MIVDEKKKQIFDALNKVISKEVKSRIHQPLKELQSKVVRRFWREAQVHSIWGADQPILYPVGSGGGTRLFYTKGEGSVLMYEYPPTVRTISIYGEYYRLSFPYVIFTISFNSGKFDRLTTTFSQKPLTDLGQTPLMSPLNNINENFVVCLGGDGTEVTRNCQNKDILSQAVEIMNYFWTSEFTESLSNLARVAKLEPRLASYHTWQEETVKNPSFIMTANLPNSAIYPTYRHLFSEVAMPNTTSQMSLATNVYKPIVEETIEEISGIIGDQPLESINNDDDLQQIIDILKSGK